MNVREWRRSQILRAARFRSQDANSVVIWRLIMINAEPPILILSLSACAGDHEVLAGILQPYGWTTHRASTLPASTALLRCHAISVVVCERDLPPHTWKDLVSEVAELAKPPLIIVSSLRADGNLWAEALNLGAYDVLPKPFDATEVRRSLSIAALHWQWDAAPGLPRQARRPAHRRRIGMKGTNSPTDEANDRESRFLVHQPPSWEA